MLFNWRKLVGLRVIVVARAGAPMVKNVVADYRQGQTHAKIQALSGKNL